MKPIENDKTTSTIEMSDGEQIRLSTVILSDDEASTLREYRDWLEARRISRTFFCPHCKVPDPMTAGRFLPKPMEAFITDHQILLSCDHRRLFYHGRTVSNGFRFVTDPPMPPGLVLYDGPVRVRLVEPERQLLVAMKHLKRKYELAESTTCQDCFEGMYPANIRGGVDDRNGAISLMCRHRELSAPPSFM